MNEPTTMKPSRDTTPRTAAVVAGIGLLAMAVIAAVSNFGVIQNLTVPGDPSATATNLVDSATRFRLGAVGLILVAALDVVVAWGLYVALRSVNPSVSLFGAWFRLAYAAIFAAVINNLFGALRAAPLDPARALFLIESFNQGWQIGMVLFGVHLGIVGALLWHRPGVFSRIVAVLLIIAGAGYLVDGLGTLLSPAYALELGMYTFAGEVVFILWLLIRGGRSGDVSGR
jgi:hypothetical protein